MGNLGKKFQELSNDDFEIINIQEGEKEHCGPTITYKYENYYRDLNTDSPLILQVNFHFSFLRFYDLKSIYNIYTYLEDFNSNKQNLSIAVEESDVPKELENTRYDSHIRETKVITFNTGTFCKEKLDIKDFLDYVVEFTHNDKKEFDRFLSDIEIKEKYKYLLDNIENYKNKNLPINFKNKKEINYKEKYIVLLDGFNDVNDFIEELEKQKGIKTFILNENKIKYNFINTNFSHTELKKYILFDSNENLYYVLEELYGIVDEVGCNLYFSTNEIMDNEISEFLLYVDKN